jgi:hypothetical protein
MRCILFWLRSDGEEAVSAAWLERGAPLNLSQGNRKGHSGMTTHTTSSNPRRDGWFLELLLDPMAVVGVDPVARLCRARAPRGRLGYPPWSAAPLFSNPMAVIGTSSFAYGPTRRKAVGI